MHKLEITGATPEDLFMNAVRMLSVLLKGGATTMPAEPVVAPSVVEPPSPADGAAPAAKAKRGRPSKNVEVPDDKLPDLTGATTTIEHDAKEIDGKPNVDHIDFNEAAEGKKPLTLDGDIRPRLRAIQKAHSERGNDMPACVAFIQRLYAPFGIQKADQLKPESFAEFMEASEAYLKGEV